jgi:hypothetical protein
VKRTCANSDNATLRTSGGTSLLRTPHVAQASPHPEGENIRKNRVHHELVSYLFDPPPTKPTTTASPTILSISLLSLSQAMAGAGLWEALL